MEFIRKEKQRLQGLFDPFNQTATWLEMDGLVLGLLYWIAEHVPDETPDVFNRFKQPNTPWRHETLIPDSWREGSHC